MKMISMKKLGALKRFIFSNSPLIYEVRKLEVLTISVPSQPKTKKKKICP